MPHRTVNESALTSGSSTRFYRGWTISRTGLSCSSCRGFTWQTCPGCLCAAPRNGRTSVCRPLPRKTETFGDGDSYSRRAGELLHPEREPLTVLDSIKAQGGLEIFS